MSGDVESLNKSLQTQSIHYAPENGILTSLVANHSPINSYRSNKKSPDEDTDPDLIPNQYGNYYFFIRWSMTYTINNMFNFNYFIQKCATTLDTENNKKIHFYQCDNMLIN